MTIEYDEYKAHESPIVDDKTNKEQLNLSLGDLDFGPWMARQERRVTKKIVCFVEILRQEFELSPHKYKKGFNMRVELNQPQTLKSPRIIFKIGSGADGQKRVSKTVGRVEEVWTVLVKLAEQEASAKTFLVLPETAVNDIMAMYNKNNPNVPTKRLNPAIRKSNAKRVRSDE